MIFEYDLVVIGGGAAGLVAATGSAALGAKTALIEKNKLGGDCTWYGCIPSKALLKAAQAYTLTKRISDFGITVLQGTKYDTGRVMSHVRDTITKVSTHHSAEVFEQRGIKVFFGAPQFIDNHTIELNGTPLTAKRFIISTGSHPFVPPIEGLSRNSGIPPEAGKDVDYLTNENVFDIQILPKSLIVLGGGPIGIELSHALSRLGVEVSIVEMVDRILFREDKEVADILTNTLIKDGIKAYTGKKAIKFSNESGLIAITLEDKNKNQSALKAEKVLVAVGRAPNVQGLNLEKAGVKFSNKGIEVDRTLKTSVNNIYACGDVVGPYQFSHMAEYQAVIAVGNALLPFKRTVNYDTVPWCTFTDPELAHVGLTEEEARAKYKDIKVYRAQYSGNDRAVTDLEETGLVKVLTDKKGYIIGAHVVGANAGEIIHEFVLAKSAHLKIEKLSSAIHIYPTLAQLVKRSADQYYTDMLNAPWLKAVFKFMLKFLR